MWISSRDVVLSVVCDDVVGFGQQAMTGGGGGGSKWVQTYISAHFIIKRLHWQRITNVVNMALWIIYVWKFISILLTLLQERCWLGQKSIGAARGRDMGWEIHLFTDEDYLERSLSSPFLWHCYEFPLIRSLIVLVASKGGNSHSIFIYCLSAHKNASFSLLCPLSPPQTGLSLSLGRWLISSFSVLLPEPPQKPHINNSFIAQHREMEKLLARDEQLVRWWR